MGFSVIQTRQDLIDYALRQLGSPSHEIEISTEQIDDAIDDTLRIAFEFLTAHYLHFIISIVNVNDFGLFLAIKTFNAYRA